MLFYEDFEADIKRIRQENEKYLDIFETYLREAGLVEKTVIRHWNNINFYINIYLLNEEPLEMARGCYKVDDFLGDYFIRKCMWSTPATIKSTAASLKKFYKCMADNGYVDKEVYKEMCDIIKNRMEFWMQDCEDYNNPDSENPFIPF